MSRTNYLILAVMFFAWLGMLSYFPFAVPLIHDLFGIDSVSLGTLMGTGVILGNVGSFILSIRLRAGNEDRLLLAAFVCFLASLSAILLPQSWLHPFVSSIWIAGSVTLYRFACGIYFNSSRAIQLSYLTQPQDRFRLLSYIKVVNSVAGGLGPLLGQFAHQKGGYTGLVIISGICFGIALFLAFFSLPKRITTIPQSHHAVNLRERPAASKKGLPFYLICTGALFHFIFEAQIYSYISMTFAKRGHGDWIALIFTVNAACLIFFGLFLARFSNFMQGRVSWLIAGSGFSLVSLLLTPYTVHTYGVMAVGILFSMGEYITPQVSLDLLAGAKERQLSNIAIYNFFTSALGLGLGFFVGGAMVEQTHRGLVNLVWLGNFALIVLAFLGAQTLRASRKNTTFGCPDEY